MHAPPLPIVLASCLALAILGPMRPGRAFAGPASSEGAKTAVVSPYSYEEALLAAELVRMGSALEPAPEGKRIENIVVACEDVVGPADPWPDIVNAMHWKTVEEVVRRELLLFEGEAYQADRVRESERNLRKLAIFAVARVVPTRGSAPDRVRLLVLTKDLWSLRLNTDFNAGGGSLQRLEAQLVEKNLFGRNKRVGLLGTLRPDSLSLGQLYVDERLAGQKLRLSETASLVLNRSTGDVEGSNGELQFERPLYTLSDPWGFSTAVAWRAQPVRIYRGGSVWQLPFPDAQNPSSRVPYAYRAREVAGAASVVRSFGLAFKTDLGAGLGAHRRRYAPGVDGALREDEAAWLKATRLPHEEDAVYLAAMLRAYEARYEVMRDLDTFGLSEDRQLGFFGLMRLRAAPALAPTLSRFVEAGAAARYRLLWHDDLLALGVAAAVRFVPGADGTGVDGSWVNRRVAAQLSNASPRLLGLGRLVTRIAYQAKADDLGRQPFLLGGDTGLRGAAAGLLDGTQLLFANLELRTRALELKTVRVGGVLFWDAGTTAPASGPVVQTVGAGLRILLPQLNVQTIRVDFGYVVAGASPSALADAFSASFGQMTDLEPALLDDPL